MAPMIGTALTPWIAVHGGASQGDASAPPTGATIALDALSRDRVLFDGGAAFGRAEAAVPVSGAATPGRGIEARAITEAGAPVTAWARVAVAGADGAWSGALTAPRGPDWLRVEARLEGSPEIAASGARRFAVGHVIALWGEAEVHRLIQPDRDNTAREPLLADDRVQIVWHDRARTGSGEAGVRHKHLTRADPHTAAVSAMANALMAERPGERFAILFQALSGTHVFDLVDDAATARAWEDDAAVHRFATRDGGHVGMAAVSWFAAPSNLGAGLEAALMPLFAGRDIEGNPVAIPGVHTWRSGTSQSQRFDHGFGELYDHAHTRWVPCGPHRFEPEGALLNAATRADGTRDARLENIEACRRAWRSMSVNPHAVNARGEPIFLPITVEPLTYLNGERDPATGSWGDTAHPASDTPDGLARFGRLAMHAVLRSAGLTGWPVPAFDQCAWDPAGGFVELGSSAGPVTTTRRARGLPRPDGGGTPLPHWTEVVGFQIDGQPARRAEITPGGRVRVHPLSGAFTPESVLTFGAGGATGALNRQADLTAGLWMDLPIVAASVAGMEGIPVRPLPDAALLASTVSADGSGGTGGGSGGGTPAPFFTRNAGNAHFTGPAIGEGVSGITMEMVVRLREQTVTGLQKLIEVTSSSLTLDVDMRPGKEQARVNMRDSAGNQLVLNGFTSIRTLPVDRWITLRLVGLHNRGDGTGFARLTVDEAPILPPPGNPGAGTFATGTGVFPAVRAFEALRSSAALDVARIAVWRTARPDGGRPEEAPFKVIAGDAAAANADPWKAGTDRFT